MRRTTNAGGDRSSTEESSFNFSAEYDESSVIGEAVNEHVHSQTLGFLPSFLLTSLGLHDDHVKDNEVDDLNDDILLAHGGANLKKDLLSTFRVNIFIKETMYNFLMFMCLPYGLWKEGYTGMKNRGYIGFHVFTAVSFWMSSITYIPLILYLVFPTDEVSLLEMVWPVSQMFLHAMVIGVKYAYTPVKEYAEINNPRVDNLKRGVRRLIALGWTVAPFPIINHEVLVASLRADVDLTKAVFTHSNTPAAVKDFFGDTQGRQGHHANTRTVSLRTVATQLQLLVRRKTASRGRVAMCALAGLIAGLIPTFVRISQGVPFAGSSPATHAIIVIAFLGTTQHGFRKSLWLVVGIADFERRLLMNKLVGDLVDKGVVLFSKRRAAAMRHSISEDGSSEERDGRKEEEEDEDEENRGEGGIRGGRGGAGPRQQGGHDNDSEITLDDHGNLKHAHRFRIDLRDPNNLVAWYQLRRVCMFFGSVISARIQSLVGISLFAIVVYTILLIIGVFVKDWPIGLTGLYSITYQILLLVSLCVVCLLFGARANLAGFRHVVQINNNKFRLQQEALTLVDPAQIEHANRVLHFHDTVKFGVQMDAELYPIRFMGVKATTGALQSMVSLAVAGISAGVRNIVYNDNVGL